MTDHRLQPATFAHERLHIDRMVADVLIIDEDGDEVEVEVPFVWTVCPTCDGRGKHVNPSVDAGGLSADDFAQDPDFRESYFSGGYDVACYGCKGRTTVPEIDTDRASADIVGAIHEAEMADAEYRAEVAAERRHLYGF
jgi:hypothetical protein